MPKIGISSYCLAGPLERGEMDLPAVMRWAKENGAEHLELVPIGYTLLENEALCRQVAETSKALALPLSNYAIPAGLNPKKDSILVESIESPYACVFAVRQGDENNETYKKVVQIYQSEAIKKFINDKYQGTILPAF